MELKLSMWDALRVQLMRHPGRNFKLILEKDSLTVEEYPNPVGMFLGDFNQQKVLETLATQGHAYVTYRGEELHLYVKTFTVFLGTVEYLGTNNYGNPKLRINGKDCNTTKSISRALFGEVRPTSHVDKFIAPYYETDKQQRQEAALAHLELEDFSLVQVRKLMGKRYPVISYQGNDYNGVTKLKEAIPQLEDEELLQQVFDHIGWKPGRARARHLDLIDTYRIEQMSDNLWELDEEVYCNSKREVQDYIRKQPGGSIGRETAKKMFIELERRYKADSRV